MMARKRGRPAADRNQVRMDLARQVLTATKADIAAGRFADLSIGELTRKAGISRSKFYVYFQDKDDLVHAYFGGVWERIFDAQSAWWELGPDVTLRQLRDVLGDLVKAYGADRELMAAVYDHALHSAVVREEVDRVIGETTARLAKHIRDGQKNGFVAASLAPTETAAWLTWMAERTQHAIDPTESLERHVDTYSDIVWHTLYANLDELSG